MKHDENKLREAMQEFMGLKKCYTGGSIEMEAEKPKSKSVRAYFFLNDEEC